MIDNGCGYMLNCGTCPGGSTCTADHRCICPDGKPPKVWYVDCDKDGFPPSWATGPAYFVESCAKPTVGPASCPQGSWTSGVPDAPRKTDCGDSSALARPGQTGFFQTGYTVDGVTSFDYDCDGKTTLEFGIPTSSTTCTADSGFCDGPVNYLNNGLPATPPCGAWRQISFCDEDPNNPLRCVRSKKFTYAKCR
ncbi:MAG TPA: hypothetical protein VGX68_03925 [Thermoanaerobaculia bacterium]|jgi:hypothetical protein|nr:hypothetical protein [Thermoanaerobaculia bacterium]